MTPYPPRTNDMAYSNYTAEEQARLDQFVAGLTALCRKHGVSIFVCGGIDVAVDVDDFKNVYYYTGNDGDLEPRSPDWR